MCLGGSRPSAPPPLPPPPPVPLPPTPPAAPPTPIGVQDVNTQVKRAKDDRGNKQKNQYSRGTGSLRIRLNQSKKPKLNIGTDTDNMTGGLN